MSKRFYKRCAVCGDKSSVNVKLIWHRYEDDKYFHVCLYCAEADAVNAESVNNYRAGQVSDEELKYKGLL